MNFRSASGRVGGYTLLELLTALVLIGILAAVGSMSYHQYLTRTKMTEGLNFLYKLRQDVVAYYYEKNELPRKYSDMGYDASYDASGIPVSGKYFDAVGCQNHNDCSQLHVHLKNNGAAVGIAGGQVVDAWAIFLIGDIQLGSAIHWTCAPAEKAETVPRMPVKYLPKQCSNLYINR